MSDTTSDDESSVSVNIEDIELHEVYFDRLLEENIKRESLDDTFLHDLTKAFRRLLDLYLQASQYGKINTLINRISQDDQVKRKDELCRVCGDLFYENEFPIYALEYYRQSCTLNPLNLQSLESFENLLNSFIERWHYRMINDRTRNTAYSKAIKKKLTGNLSLRILDIGCGCGVLSAQCLYGGAGAVYACEQSEVFYQITEKLLKTELNVSLINKHSDDLNVEVDLDGRQVDVVVTEIFDDGLLGEKCLETFYNAVYKNNLVKADLTTKRFCIIPQYARIFMCAIESEAIRKANFYRFTHTRQEIKVLSYSDCEAFGKSDRFEPYTTESLNKIEFKMLTEPVEIEKFKIEFDNYELLKDLCELDSAMKTHTKLRFIEGGYVDAYVVWFDLYLDDELHITNSPFEMSTETRATCWHQAIYPTFDRIGNFKENQSLVAEISLRKDCLLINKLSCDDVARKEDTDISSNSVYATQNEISSLHDSKYQSFYIDCFSKIKNLHDGDEMIRIGLYCSCFNILLLEFLSGKYDSVDNIELVVLSSYSQNENFCEYIEKQEKIKFIDLDSLLEDTEKGFKIDYLIYEVIDLKLGVLRKNLFSNLLLIRDLLLKETSHIYPSTISIHGRFIESDDLMNEATLLSNENLCVNKLEQFDLKTVLKDYAVSHQYAINKTQTFKNLSTTQTIFEIDLRFEKSFEKLKSIEFDIIDYGKVTAFLYWSDYEATFTDNATLKFDSYSSFINSNLNLAGIVEYNNFETKSSQTGIKTNALLKQDVFYIQIKEIF